MSTTDEDPDKMVKNSWTPEEDVLLREQIDKHGGPGNWTAIAEALVGRSSKSCRLRWCNQLNPTVKRGPFTEEEDKEILAAHAVYGNKWAVISRGIPGRTDNQVKNRFNSTLRRVLAASARGAAAPSAKRRRRSDCDSPSSPGKSANSCETRAIVESASEGGAIVGLEQLVAASLQVERREGDGEAEDTSAKSTATKAHAAAGAADNEGSVRGAHAFADHASLLAGMQMQQQLAQLAAAAYPAFHGVPVIPQSLPTAKVMPAGPGAALEAQRAAAPGTSGAEAMTAMTGNSFVAALQAQLAVSRALSQVKSVWDPPQAVPYAGQRAPTPAELVAALVAAQTPQ